MEKEKIFAMPFAEVYPLLIAKAERKGRTRAEVDAVTSWLTGYTSQELDRLLDGTLAYRQFFTQAPRMNEERFLIGGSICGVKLREIVDPLMRDIRILDKLVDELAKGKAVEKILSPRRSDAKTAGNSPAENATVKGEITMLEIGMKAPDFTLPDKDGNPVSLSDFWGKKVVLYFYPRDNTPGCTRQACAFAQSNDRFRERDVVVIGVSKDSVASHAKFAQKYDLPFLLLSDPELQAIQAYGVWQEKKLYGKVSMGVVRSTYLIDEAGNIAQVMPKVKPDTNAEEILAYLDGQA